MSESDTSSKLPWRTWFKAMASVECQQQLDAIYKDLGEEIKMQQAQGGPYCRASGRCCDFEKWGHRLYVTGLEIAYFLTRLKTLQEDRKQSEDRTISLAQLNERPTVQPLDQPCMFQVDGMCSTHEIRPLGCRIFFCDEASDDWQHEVYETYFKHLKALHEELGLPYSYMEWRLGLREGMAMIQGATDTY